MKIVTLDAYTENPGDLSWAPLEALGEVEIYDRTSVRESPLIAERLAGADIAVTNKTPLSRATIEKCPDLKAIAVLATGYNIIDCACAAERGIPVMNVPAYGTQIVAQYAVGMLLEICSHFAHHDQAVKEGRWTNNIEWCFWDYPMIELAGKTAGIVGFGRIGRTTGKIVKAMGMRVLACDKAQSEEGRAIGEYVDLDRLLAESDVIFLHCPLFPDTKEMINRETIARMKDGVILINNSRGALVVEEDLAEALNSGKVYAAGLDVTAVEPIPEDNPLLGAKNCLITPHISWAAKEARQRILDTTVENVQSFLAGKPVNVVNG